MQEKNIENEILNVTISYSNLKNMIGGMNGVYNLTITNIPKEAIDTKENSSSELNNIIMKAPKDTYFNMIDLSIGPDVYDFNLCFNGNNNVKIFNIKGGKGIATADGAFQNCKMLERVFLNFENAKNVVGMFRGCSDLINIEKVYLGTVKNIDSLCEGCKKLKTVEFKNFETSITANNAFKDCESIYGIADITNYKDLKDANSMFYNCKELVAKFSNNLKSLENANYMLCNTAIRTFNFDLPSLKNANHMLENCKFLRTVKINKSIENAESFAQNSSSLDFVILEKSYQNLKNALKDCCEEIEFDTSDYETFKFIKNNKESIGVKKYLFEPIYDFNYEDISECIASLTSKEKEVFIKNIPAEAFSGDKTSKLSEEIEKAADGVSFELNITVPKDCKSLKNLFRNSTKVNSLKIRFDNPTNINDISGAFCDCKINNIINYSKLDGDNIIADETFKNSELKNFNRLISGKVVSSISMFENCKNLENINTSIFLKVKNAKCMFKNCYSLKDIVIENFTSLENAESMFENCPNVCAPKIFSLYLKNAKRMFKGCEKCTCADFSLIPSLENAESMFENCPNVEKLTIKKDSPVENIKNCFKGNSKKIIINVNNNYDVYKWVEENIKNLDIKDYEILFMPKERLNVNELKEFIRTYNEGIYNVIISKINKEELFELNDIINKSKENTLFNIAVNVPEDCDNLDNLFKNNKHIRTANLARAFNVKSCVSTFENCSNMIKYAIQSNNIIKSDNIILGTKVSD